ncbi:uncharacterized protein LOC144879193 [Branchiostoma floridae x Branchiostoma japonicum]
MENASEDDKLGFLEEIRAVVHLGFHDNLLGLINCCTVVRDHLYLITKFMPYGDLKSFLRKCREEENSDEPREDIYNFEVMQMYQVARQIARGMDHIARSRYVHGDLAARNVLVGERLKVKISDFGLAEDIYSRGYRRQDRLQKIPLKWMAPERMEGGGVYTAQKNASEDDKLGFLEEIRAVVHLGFHDNLLGLINCCTVVRDHLYLITKFMPYGDLKSFLRKCREEENSDEPREDIYNFEVMQMYQVARQIARGMDHIARSRYVHGDLAARNVLVGERLKVKISDFGLAEDIYSRGYRRQDRLQKIPLKWMAPERMEGGGVYTAQKNASEDDKLGFLEEIRAVVHLGFHDNLLGLINCCTVVRDHLYLITKFMPYGDLKSFLRKCREEENSDEPREDIYNFEVMQMYQVARQIARGMDHIARSRYVHGDLAARNVLVGERLKVKISDFGLAEDIYSRG